MRECWMCGELYRHDGACAARGYPLELPPPELATSYPDLIQPLTDPQEPPS